MKKQKVGRRVQKYTVVQIRAENELTELDFRRIEKILSSVLVKTEEEVCYELKNNNSSCSILQSFVG